jgi:glycyl-tRNA synthetase beta subunit
VAQRWRGWLLEAGYRHDLVDALLAEQGDRPAVALATLRRLSDWVARPEFAALLTAYSRPSRIVRDQVAELPLRPDRLTLAAERDLYAAVLAAQQQRAAVRDLDGLLGLLGPLTQPIATFFEQVFVMDDDPAARENRLALLQRIAALAKGIVDLTKVQGY